MKRLSFVIIVSTLLFSWACKSTKDMEKTQAISRGDLVTNLDTAVLALPVHAEINDIVRFFETSFGQFQFGEPSDDLVVKATLRKGIKIWVHEDSLNYRIPMDLKIRQKTFLGSIDAHGSISLLLQSKYDIDGYWNLKTSTRVIDHEWLEKPQANMSVIRLSIESLSDRLIARNKEQLAANIDAQIASNMNLKKSINDIWYRLKSPMEVSEVYKVWLQLKPISLSVSRITQKGQGISAYINAKVTPKVIIGQRPVDFKLDSVPKFEWLSKDTSGYLIPVRMTLPDQEIADFANAFLEEEVFDLGKIQIQAKDVKINRINNKWKVQMMVYGDVNGSVTLTGIPAYDGRKEEIELKNFDYSVDSKNLILKGSELLFKQKVQKRLLEQLNELVKSRKRDLLAAIDEQLLKTNRNQWLGIENNIDRLTIYDLGLDEHGMWVYILLGGECRAKFKYQVAATP